MTRCAMGVLGGVLWAASVWGAEGQVQKYCRFQAGKVTAYRLLAGERVRPSEGTRFGARTPPATTCALADVRLLVPVRPTKVLAMAGNYKSHLGKTPPHKAPELFLKPPSCLIPTGAAILYPHDCTV